MGQSIGHCNSIRSQDIRLLAALDRLQGENGVFMYVQNAYHVAISVVAGVR
jgi:hypothetical protein